MLETITLGDIGVMVAFLVALISGVGFLIGRFKKWISDSMSDEFGSVKKELADIKENIENVDMEHCKNFLVSFLSDVKQGKALGEIEKERFWEQYAHYTKTGHNGYIKSEVESLRAKGLI